MFLYSIEGYIIIKKNYIIHRKSSFYKVNYELCNKNILLCNTLSSKNTELENSFKNSLLCQKLKKEKIKQIKNLPRKI